MIGRTALITGVFGQDGSLLAELLVSRGYRVVGVGRPGGTCIAGTSRDVLTESVDLTDAAQVRAVLEKHRPDELFHFAAFHHAAQDKLLSADLAGKAAMTRVNFSATQTIAFALAEMHPTCHLVFASSSQVYTPMQMTHEIDEASARRPHTFYGHTKSWSMDLLAQLRRESHLRASSAILFNHESPRRGLQFVTRKITHAAAGAAAGKPVTLHLRNIGARVDWSHARDSVHAMSLMAQSDSSRDYVVASGALHSVRNFLDQAFGSVDVDWRLHVTFDEDRETPALIGNSSLLERHLAWRRQCAFEDIVAEMVRNDSVGQLAENR